MKEFLNKTTIYSTALAISNIFIAACCSQSAKSVFEFWRTELRGEPLPWLSEKIMNNPGANVFPVFFMIVFLVFAILAIKKGKCREIAFHAMMITVFCELFYLLTVIVALTLPTISGIKRLSLLG